MLRRRWRQFLLTLVRAPLFALLGAVGGFGTGVRIDPRKVAIYIRWSTDDQSEGTTLDIQRDGCRHYALSQGWNVPDELVFIDDGYSGGDLNRPGITRLRELVRQGQVECVVVYKIDRLSRNIVDATGLVLQEWDGVCHLKCVTEPIDTTTELGRVIFSILATFADFERSTIRNRLFSGKVQRASEGRNPGIRLPFGYVRGEKPGEVVVDEGQAAIVRRIFESYAAGMGTHAIAAELNADGLTGYFGREWSKATIQKMLRNEAYIGRQIYGRSVTNPRRKTSGGPTRLQRDEPLVVRDDGYPAIISPELFERCRHIRADRIERLKTTSGRALTSPHLLTGLARCQCGHALQAWQQSRNSTRNRVPVYKCAGRVSKGAVFCDAAQISQPVLDELVVSEVRRLASPDVRQAFLDRYADSIQRQITDLEAQVEQTRQQLAGLDEQEEQAYQDYRAKRIGPTVLERLRKDITADRERLTSGLQQLRERLERARSSEAERVAVDHTLDLVAGWDQWDTPMRKQILQDLITSLTVYRPSGSKEIKVEIRFRLLDQPGVLKPSVVVH